MRCCWLVWLTVPALAAPPTLVSPELSAGCQRATALVGSPGFAAADCVAADVLAARLLRSSDGLAPRLRAVLSAITRRDLERAAAGLAVIRLPDALAAALNEGCVRLAPGNDLDGPRLAAAERLIRDWAGSALAPASRVVWDRPAELVDGPLEGRLGGTVVTVGALGERDFDCTWPFAAAGPLLSAPAAQRRAIRWLRQAGVDLKGWYGPVVKTTERHGDTAQSLRWSHDAADPGAGEPNHLEVVLGAAGVCRAVRVFDPPVRSGGPVLTREQAAAAARLYYCEPRAAVRRVEARYGSYWDRNRPLCWELGMQLRERQLTTTVDASTGRVAQGASPTCLSAAPLPLPQFLALLDSAVQDAGRWRRYRENDIKADRTPLPAPAAEALCRLVAGHVVDVRVRPRPRMRWGVSAATTRGQRMIHLSCDTRLANWYCLLTQLGPTGDFVLNQSVEAHLPAEAREEARRLLGLDPPPNGWLASLLLIPLAGALAWRWRRRRATVC